MMSGSLHNFMGIEVTIDEVRAERGPTGEELPREFAHDRVLRRHMADAWQRLVARVELLEEAGGADVERDAAAELLATALDQDKPEDHAEGTYTRERLEAARRYLKRIDPSRA
jgi:hypothetical protein